MSRKPPAKKDLAPFKDIPVHLDEIHNNSSTSHSALPTPHSALPTPHSIDLPLILRGTHADFTILDSGRRQQGRVFSQRRHLDNPACHPTAFYIEFPAESATFFEVDVNRVCATLGDSSASGPFSRAEVARIMQVPRHEAMPFTKLLTSSRPA